MKDIFFEIMQDVLEDRILYGYDCTPGPDDVPIDEPEQDSEEELK